MPRIVVTSDTHLGITTVPELLKLVESIRREQPDAVVIAGDIGEGVENVEIVLNEFRSLGVPVAACAGNHDLWNHDKRHPSEKMWKEILPDVARSSGGVWLDGENLIVDGIAVVGSVAWYDYSAQDPLFRATEEVVRARKKEFDADAWMIDWPWTDVEFCRMIEPGFRERLTRAQDDPAVREIIVVTHCPIFEGQMKRKPGNFKWGFSNAYYGNLTFGGIVRGFGKVTHAIAGHTHAGMEGVEEINGCPIRVITLDSQYNGPAYEVVVV
jgi:hypothetical protein